MGKYSRRHQETTKAHHVLQPPTIRLSYSGLRTKLCTTHELCGSCSELRCTRSVLRSTCADLCGSRPDSGPAGASADGPAGSCPDCGSAGASAGDAAGPSADHCAAGTSADGPAGSCPDCGSAGASADHCAAGTSPDHCGTSVLCSTASQ